MNKKPRLSVIIPWCGRSEIKTTFAENSPLFAKHDAEAIVVNCGGDSTELARLLAKVDGCAVRRIDVPRHRFNKSLAINIGLYCSRAPSFFMLDADVILNLELIKQAEETLSEDTFVTVKWVVESEVKSETAGFHDETETGCIAALSESMVMEFKFADQTELHHVTFRKMLSDPLRSRRRAGGLILVHKRHLQDIGGYDSRLERWGWEDDDVQIRLRRRLGLRQIEVGEALHLSHGDEKRAVDGGTRDSSDRENFIFCCRKYARSELVGTYQSDVAEWQGQIVCHNSERIEP